MRITNAHVHLIEIDKILAEKEQYLHLMSQIPSFQKIQETLPLLSVDQVLTQMNEAGITMSVLFACYAPILFASNEFVADICQKHPDKFIGFASVDPLNPGSPVILEHAITQLGLKGLKLHPPLQNFYPHDKKFWPLYQKAMELDIPVVFHVGSTPFGAMVKLNQADPMLLDEVACAFPKLKIILTHLGTMWHYQAFMVAEKNPNVYIDTAAYPHEIRQLLTMDLIERIGEHKFIFGTDFPMPYESGVHRMKDFVDCLLSLRLPEHILNKILHENIEALLPHAAV